MEIDEQINIIFRGRTKTLLQFYCNINCSFLSFEYVLRETKNFSFYVVGRQCFLRFELDDETTQKGQLFLIMNCGECKEKKATFFNGYTMIAEKLEVFLKMYGSVLLKQVEYGLQNL